MPYPKLLYINHQINKKNPTLCVLPVKAPPTSGFRPMKTRPYLSRALDVRVNMAASMASQAAARGLRTATSKHVLLDKLKVLSEFTLLRGGVPWCRSCLCHRMCTAVALRSSYCSYLANGFSLSERFNLRMTAHQSYGGALWLQGCLVWNQRSV